MKIQHTITFFLLVAACLTSCEMKDEIFDKNKISGDTGYLNLAVSVQDKATRAATDEGTNNNSPVSADNFEVEISNNEGTYEKKFESYTELQAAGKIELPVGKYTIKAHTPGTIAPKMDYPFYNGQETLEITKGVEKTTTVTCTMQNTKIQMTYDPTFATIFKEWDITISDGTSNVLTYDETNLNPTAKYWLIGENVSEIKVHIEAYLQDGTRITEDRSITKPEDADSDFWAGSDALTITMEPGEPSDPENPNGVTINVKVEISFTDDEVTEEIPVEGEGSDEGEGGDTTDPDEGEDGGDSGETSAPTLSGEYLNDIVIFAVSQGTDNFPNVEIKMDVPKGIQNVIVKAETDNSKLEGILNGMGFASGIDLVGTTAPVLVAALGNIPKSGDKSYTFSVNGTIKEALAASPGTHKFDVTVTDLEGQSVNGTLTFNITDTTAN